MADGHILALQKAVVAVLRADADVSAEVGARVVDHARPDIGFPYIELSRFESDPADTDGTLGFDVTFAVNVHSRKDPPQTIEAKRTGEAVIAALHRQESALTVVGFDVVTLQYITGVAEDDGPDGDVLHRLAFDARLDVST